MDDIEKLAEELEPAVDRHGIADVLEALAVLAALKADHVATNWGDRGLAKSWEHVSRKIEQTAGVAKKHQL